MKKRTTYLLSVAFTMSAVAMSAIGCGSDPDGTPGGTGGAGGRSPGGTGGAGGTAPSLGPIVGTPVATFDIDAGSFILSNYVPTNTEVNLAGTGTATMAMTTLTWDATQGDPAPGSLKVTAPFSDWNQWIEVQASTQMPLLNWTDKKMHVRMKVASGFVSDMFARPGAQALVNATASYVQVNSGSTIPPGGAWQEFVVDLTGTTVAGFDATMVITYGIHIYSGMGNATAAKPAPAVFYVDSFSIE